MGLPVVRAQRVIAAERRGSSMPLLVDTEQGRYMTKVRGAAQGTAVLIAEVLVAELAEVLGLTVPRRVLVQLGADTPSDDRNDEVADLRRASVGLNLGFEYLDAARVLRAEQVALLGQERVLRTLWLDWLVTNADRTWSNPNILIQGKTPYWIDHGAALHFQYGWSDLTEDSPGRSHFHLATHLFADRAADAVQAHTALAALISRERLERAAAMIPTDFLTSAGAPNRPTSDPERHRMHFVAFLWKRLKTPPSWP
jgi:hypothetical protein